MLEVSGRGIREEGDLRAGCCQGVGEELEVKKLGKG
jgi:hypothetical protein